MKKQGYNARLDESLGERRGPERDFKQSYKARRDESRGASHRDRHYGGFNLKDNAQAGKVYKINANSEQFDLHKIKKFKIDLGYPEEAY